jgi:SAM-dependent methyltransferase
LLEIGFGSGAFLESARNCGWSVSGIDVDKKVVRAMRERGFDARLGGVEDFDGEAEQFDVIVMNHVIEHVHQPSRVLARCYDLIKPGGMLYIETPNLQSLGHTYFGRNWRDLDSPRHLVLFTPGGLSRVLNKSGFESIRWKGRTNPVRAIALHSVAIEQGKRLEDVLQLPPKELRFVRQAKFLQTFVRGKREYITFVCQKEG